MNNLRYVDERGDKVLTPCATMTCEIVLRSVYFGIGLAYYISLFNPREGATMRNVYHLFDNSGKSPQYIMSLRAASRLDAIMYGRNHLHRVVVAVRASAL